jgi:organic radical activating enzyme
MSANDTTLEVSEIFDSLQGEGPTAGCPCLFIRLAMCNLRCGWCDTKYSWDFGTYDYAREVRRMLTSELAEVILASEQKRLVITGGEPLVQRRGLLDLIARLPSTLEVEVETNGTLPPPDELLERVDQWNVSPKLANSGEPLARRIKPEVLQRFRVSERAWLKLVTATALDFREADELISLLDWPRDRVLLMPLAATPVELAAVAPRVAAACEKYQLRFSPRLHLQLFAGARGR